MADEKKQKAFSTDSVIILDTASATVADLTNGEATWQLQVPMQFRDSNPLFCLNTFSFTNFFINIFTGINDTLYYTDDLLDMTKYSVVFPQGSYSIESMNTFWVNTLLEDAFAPGMSTLMGDYSQQRVYIQYAAGAPGIGWTVYFAADSPFALMGAVVATAYPAALTVAGSTIAYLPNQAAFNNVERINIHTNLGNNFIYSGAIGDIIYSTTPTASVGSTNLDKPYNLLWCSSDALRSGISSIYVYLTDQTGARINMTEDFMVILQVRI